jgi:SAM-dependent methyltransferase
VTTAALDADLGDSIAANLLSHPVVDLAAFEAAFIATVEASAKTPDLAWDHFYDATLGRVTRGWGRELPGAGTVATFTRIWSRAAALSRGPRVLDVGTCFGFFPLAWSSVPGAPRMLATDLSAAAAMLAARQARRLTAGVDVVCADGTRLPVADRAFSTVHLLHVLEHVPAPVSEHLLLEALRVAERRVVVAVPVEVHPDPVFGHVQVFDLTRLAALGRCTGWRASLVDADGAWLVLDRP